MLVCLTETLNQNVATPNSSVIPWRESRGISAADVRLAVQAATENWEAVSMKNIIKRLPVRMEALEESYHTVMKAYLFSVHALE